MEWIVPLEIVIRIFEFAILIFSLCVHESAHAWMASRLGDQTARLQGRITLNPAYHIDPIGTLLIPGLALFGKFIGLGFLGGFLIGWARPVPVNTRNFKNIVRDDNLTTAAGPLSNLMLATISFLLLLVITHLVPGAKDVAIGDYLGLYDVQGPILKPIMVLLTLSIYINLILCFFNLLSVAPLDGHHFVRNMLPYNALRVYDGIPPLVSLAVMILFGGYFIGVLMRPVWAMVGLGLQL